MRLRINSVTIVYQKYFCAITENYICSNVIKKYEQLPRPDLLLPAAVEVATSASEDAQSTAPRGHRGYSVLDDWIAPSRPLDPQATATEVGSTAPRNRRYPLMRPLDALLPVATQVARSICLGKGGEQAAVTEGACTRQNWIHRLPRSPLSSSAIPRRVYHHHC
jgi:hypothetical protein